MHHQNRDFLTGKMLVATPALNGGCFEEAVILICRHDEKHAMGLIVNQHLEDFPMRKLLKQVNISSESTLASQPVHFGGPVETARGMVLHALEFQLPETITVTPNIGMTANKDILKCLNAPNQHDAGQAQSLICLGHVGWGPGQLESEYANDSWLYMDVDEKLVFASDPENTWPLALAAIGLSANHLLHNGNRDQEHSSIH